MSTKILEGLYYTDDDEWIKVDGDVATVGISDYAQDSLSDIVYLELPSEGESFAAGETFGVVESVKAAGDLMLPVSGEVIEVNESLLDEPEAVNSDPYNSWMVKIKISDPSEINNLMDAAAYTDYCAERE